VGNIFSILFIGYALTRKNKELMQVALAFTVLVAILGFVADVTGGRAAHEVEDLPGITRDAIEAHEHAAEESLYFLYGAGALSVLSFILVSMNRKVARIFIVITFLVALSASWFLYRAGYLGGLIRHPEISRNR